MKTILDPAAKGEIIARVGRLTAASERRWGKMNAHQMVCHLNDSLLLVMGEMAAADRSNVMSRSVVKLIALRAPMQWPKGVQTVPEIDQSAGGGTPPALFDADCNRFVQLLGRFTAPKRDFAFAPHPIFSVMTEWEWMRWAYLHADHHLRQFGL